MMGQRPAPLYAAPSPDWLTDEVLPRRLIAWCLDGVLIAMAAGLLWISGIAFGLFTFGLGFSVLRLLPLVPFAYHTLFLMSPLSATPGQRMMDLIVRRNEDLGAPTAGEAVVSVLAFYATLALGVIWVGLALLTPRGRTPHDLISGLVVVRARTLDAIETGRRPGGSWDMRFGGRSNA